jgi:hypothetical protein
VVEQHAVAGVHAVGLAVVDGDPEGVELGDGVGGAGVEGGGDLLGDLLHLAVQLRGGGLVEAAGLLEAQDADGLQQAQRAHAVGVGGVLGALERHGHVALGAQVVDLVGLDELDDADEVGGVGEVAVVQEEALAGLRLLVEAVDAGGVQDRGAALDAVHDVALVEEELGEVGAILREGAGREGGGGEQICQRRRGAVGAPGLGTQNPGGRRASGPPNGGALTSARRGPNACTKGGLPYLAGDASDERHLAGGAVSVNLDHGWMLWCQEIGVKDWGGVAWG